MELSIPDVLGAIVLKGAAYKEDARDRDRHLDDAALLLCAMTDPFGDALRLQGHDRGRILALAHSLSDPTHRSWLQIPADLSQRGLDALRLLTRNPQSKLRPPGLGGRTLDT